MSDLPLTRILPKTMLPVVNKPIIHYVADRMVNIGIRRIYIIVNSLDSPIVRYFGNGTEFGAEMTYVVQKEPTGIADAVLLAEDYVHDPFLVILGDSFIQSDSLSDFTSEIVKGSVTAIEGVTVEHDLSSLKRTCCVEADESGFITRIVEKPSAPTTSYRGCGIYAFTRDIFNAIRRTPRTPPRNEREITNTIGLLGQERKAKALKISGFDVNINVLADLLKATRLALHEMQEPAAIS